MQNDSPTSKTTADPGATRIDVADASGLSRWTKEFDVSEDQLKAAVAKVGAKAADVELYLKGSRSATNGDVAEAADAADAPAVK